MDRSSIGERCRKLKAYRPKPSPLPPDFCVSVAANVSSTVPKVLRSFMQLSHFWSITSHLTRLQCIRKTMKLLLQSSLPLLPRPAPAANAPSLTPKKKLSGAQAKGLCGVTSAFTLQPSVCSGIHQSLSRCSKFVPPWQLTLSTSATRCRLLFFGAPFSRCRTARRACSCWALSGISLLSEHSSTWVSTRTVRRPLCVFVCSSSCGTCCVKMTLSL